jgi:UDP-3-O-[3-hydroxymyristoyl] N-acetylglucosamine deacetylase
LKETRLIMDGLPPDLPPSPQRTLRQPIGCVGVGLHTGRKVALTLRPAPAGTGIRFRRTDMDAEVPARFDRVLDTRLCTVLAPEGRPEVRIGTVEHVMAALAGCGVDNAVVELDGPEVPILDGSAAPFVFLIGCAGVVPQGLERRAIRVRRTVRVTDGEAEAVLMPSDQGFEVELGIAFQDAAIGRQHMVWRAGEAAFRRDLSHARTFARAADIAALRAAGLARGGSLDNAVVVDGDRILNPGGLRMADEFVRHKVLDVVGDLALAGAPLLGRFTGRRSGHALNNRVLRALFADAANWAWNEPADLPMAVAAA